MRHLILTTAFCLLLLVAPVQTPFIFAQDEVPVPIVTPIAVQSNDTLLLAIVALVLPVTTLLINFFSTRASAEQARTIASQAKTIDALVVKLDGLPLRVAELIANNLLREQFADELKKALTDAGVAKKDQPVETPQKKLTPLKPPGLIEELELDKLDSDAAKKPPPDSPPKS